MGGPLLLFRRLFDRPTFDTDLGETYAPAAALVAIAPVELAIGGEGDACHMMELASVGLTADTADAFGGEISSALRTLGLKMAAASAA